MPLFEVAMIKVPTPKEMEEGAAEELVVPITAVVAGNEQSAAIQVAMTKKLDIDMARVQVLVRPFAKGSLR